MEIRRNMEGIDFMEVRKGFEMRLGGGFDYEGFVQEVEGVG